MSPQKIDRNRNFESTLVSNTLSFQQQINPLSQQLQQIMSPIKGLGMHFDFFDKLDSTERDLHEEF